jgi:hypothetical protein
MKRLVGLEWTVLGCKCCDEEIGGSGVDSVGCKCCRCGRNILVSKMVVFSHVGY